MDSQIRRERSSTKRFLLTTGLAGCLMALCITPAVAAPYRPLPPKDLRVTPDGPDGVRISATSLDEELIHFEVEMTENGARATPLVESELSRPFWSVAPGEYRVSRPRNLAPETEYCFRMWSRVLGSGITSALASNWVCARTTARRPLMPLDVAAKLTDLGAKVPRLSWNTPDQSDHRGITRFIIERQSPPGPNRPWLLEKTVPGPGGEQETRTRLALAVDGGPIDPNGKHVYRICAENSGGRSCATPVDLTASHTLVGSANGAAHDIPQPAVAPRPAEESRPSSATMSARSLSAQTQEHIALASTTTTATQARSRADPATQIAPDSSSTPPNTTVLQPRSTTISSSGTAPIATAAPASTNPSGQIQGKAGGLASDALSQNAEIAEGIQLICQGSGTRPAIGPYYQAAPDGAERQMMYFTIAAAPARADGSGLTPGKCAFVDHPVAETGVQILLFRANSTQADEVTRSLTPSEGYWRFIVRQNEAGSHKDESGFYEAAAHSEWLPPASPTAGTSAGIENRVIASTTPVLSANRPNSTSAVTDNLDARLIEILCRGGFSPASFDKPAALQNSSSSNVMLRLHFNRELARPDEFGRGLKERHCAPRDQAWSWDKIPFSASGYDGYIVFETANREQAVKRSRHGSKTLTAAERPDELNIPEYLADPGNYWRFFITKGDDRTTLFANRHERWMPGATLSLSNPSARPVRNDDLTFNDDMRIARLINVKVRPTIGGAAFRFIARNGATPTIELSTQEPVTGRDGLKVLPKPLTLQAGRDMNASSDAVNWYTAATEEQRLKLVQNTDYHYLITVPGDAADPLQQHTGKFRTLQRVLKVKFKSIQVIDDADDMTNGEGTFYFCVNDKHVAQSFGTFSSNSTLQVNRELVLEKWEDGPVKIALEGIEDDSGFIPAGNILWSGCSLSAPADSNNMARMDIDTRSPELSGRRGAKEFRMRSFQDGDLLFSTLVQVEVLRPE